jgi:glycosyltransferase involved in cell wall biosynthesis
MDFAPPQAPIPTASRSLEVESLSIFFPVYNDWGTIPSMVVLAEAAAVGAGIDDYEIILVDDGSQDRTQRVVDELAARVAAVRVIRHEVNRGYGAALRSGFGAARKQFIFYTDGDAQYDPSELETLIERVRPGVDVVNGFKVKRNDPWYRVVVGWLYQHFARLLFRLPISDVDCDFRLMRRETLGRIQLRQDSGVICLELIKKLTMAGARFEEAPVSHHFRASGRSQFFRPARLTRVAIGILRLWFELRSQQIPRE